MNSSRRLKDFIKRNFSSWERIDLSLFEEIDFSNEYTEIYKIENEEIICISYANISITGSDRPKPQLRVFLDEYKKPFSFAKKHLFRYFLFTIFTKEDEMARGLDNFNPKEFVVSIETNLDVENSRRDLRSIYDYANEKIGDKRILKCSRENYRADINTTTFIYIGTEENETKEYFNNFISIFDSRPYLNSSIRDFPCDFTAHRVCPLQTIYYGAPGTGKSHKIKTLHKENVVRTTFHPDSDYSTFVGAYKPTMEEVERYESSGTPIREKRIVYNYVPQAFLRAYTSAWKNYPKPQYLVIEEINRGNCAQIFGDLFQLLDRHETGFSDYPICADSDIQRYLSEEFSKCNFTEIIGEETEAIQEMYAQECPDILNQLKLGNLLLLPKNLYILATMNTSDQSLFPIDSAFKRRWHWEYTPIRNGGKEWTIEANGQHWDWWAFLQAINERIEEATSSEDKKLGYFFVKAGDKGASIKASLFVGKVIFYLWNDVYKDYGFDDSIFQDSNGKQMTFPRFYEINEANEEVNEVLVANFLRNVVGQSIEESHSDEINENKE